MLDIAGKILSRHRDSSCLKLSVVLPLQSSSSIILFCFSLFGAPKPTKDSGDFTSKPADLLRLLKGLSLKPKVPVIGAIYCQHCCKQDSEMCVCVCVHVLLLVTRASLLVVTSCYKLLVAGASSNKGITTSS